MSTLDETAANSALENALKTLQYTTKLCELAGYGNQVLDHLAEAQQELKYALITATGKI